MAHKQYTEGEKAEALRLLEEEGIWSAVSATGAAHNTIYRWHAAHVRTLKKTPEEIANEEDEERILGVRLRRRMLLTAMAHVDRSDAAGSAIEGLRWMTAAGIAFDKLNKVGGASSTFVLTPEVLESEIARMEEELGRVAPNNARALRQADAADIDKSLSQTLDEWERKIRADVTAELTGKDALGRSVMTPKQWDQAADEINSPNGQQPSQGDR
jgi:hypothetical protein